jgi:hypothetical protein
VPPERYGDVYLGSNVKVSFAEAILRDRGVRRIKSLPLDWAELEKWTCAKFQRDGLADQEPLPRSGPAIRTPPGIMTAHN